VIRVRLAEILRAHKLSYRALSRRTGLCFRTVWEFGTGRSTRIDLNTLDRICSALRLRDVGVLLHVEGGRQPKRIPKPERQPKYVHPADCVCYDCLFPERTEPVVPKRFRVVGRRV
jgi:DNA-binding Xre family transcriptional regulator